MTPVVSIISGTYNRIEHLKKFVYSVRRSIGTGINYEIIIVAGPCTDGTENWCREQADIRLIEQDRLVGAIRAFGAGFDIAQGRYVLIANDDIIIIGKSITRAIAYMDDHPNVGIGCFYQDRAGRSMHVDMMPAHYADGTMTSVHYGQVCIVDRAIGNAVGWWGHNDPHMSKAKTYGGDNYCSSRVIELGYAVVPLDGCAIHDLTPQDELRQLNNPVQLRTNNHPDTAVYLSIYPTGPLLDPNRTLRTRQIDRPKRVLYAPIYEKQYPAQREQKCGLRRALQRKYDVIEVDYMSGESLIDAARDWQPELTIIQAHESSPVINEEIMKEVKRHTKGKLAIWNGDVYDKSGSDDYLRLLRQADFFGTVNADAIKRYNAAGVNAGFWNVGYEPYILTGQAAQGHDVVFFGNGYSPQRQVLGQQLTELATTTNLTVGIYGDRWQSPVQAVGSTLYDFQRTGAILRKSKIAIGDSQHSGAGFASDRLFNTLAAGGAILLHQHFEGMTEYTGLVDGVHLVMWTDYADLHDKILYYMRNPIHAKMIAQQGQSYVLRAHSFEVRLKELDQFLLRFNRPVNEWPDNLQAGYDPSYA